MLPVAVLLRSVHQGFGGFERFAPARCSRGRSALQLSVGPPLTSGGAVSTGKVGWASLVGAAQAWRDWSAQRRLDRSISGQRCPALQLMCGVLDCWAEVMAS